MKQERRIDTHLDEQCFEMSSSTLVSNIIYFSEHVLHADSILWIFCPRLVLMKLSMAQGKRFIVSRTLYIISV